MSMKNLTWNDRLALIDHYHPSDHTACTVFDVTPDELATAREMKNAGTFSATTELDVASYSSMFANPPADPKPVTSTSTVKPTNRQTATKPTSVPKKRGRKGNKVANAFSAIPNSPTPAEKFASAHHVSIAVLRQGKRFDKSPDLGPVRVKKDKDTGVLMVWRESETS